MNKKASCTNVGLRLLGDYWSLSIIQGLQLGEKRFCKIERLLPGINPTTLTNRLKKLESEKIISRREETIDKLSVTYVLTQKGLAVVPIIRAIATFASTYP